MLNGEAAPDLERDLDKDLESVGVLVIILDIDDGRTGSPWSMKGFSTSGGFVTCFM